MYFQVTLRFEDDAEIEAPQAKVPRVPTFPGHNQSQSSKRTVSRGTINALASTSTASSTTGTKTGFETKVIQLLTEVSLELKELRKRVDNNTLLLQDLLTQRSDVSLRDDPNEMDMGVVLPVTTIEELEALELKLDEEEYAKQLVLKLAVLGGKDVQSMGKTILCNLLSPELARQYNYTGANGKNKFQCLKLNKVILRAVHHNTTPKDATKDEVKTSIMSFLNNARRSKRRLEQPAQQIQGSDETVTMEIE